MKTIEINMQDRFGTFLSNGSLASDLCMNEILPAISQESMIVINMAGIENMTDSFANTLIANMIISQGDKFFGQVKFSNCSALMRDLILISIKFGKFIKEKHQLSCA